MNSDAPRSSFSGLEISTKSTVFRQEITQELIYEGYVIPWWRGIAYKRYDIMTYVVYPIPFNLIVRWTYNFWRRVRCFNSANYLEQIQKTSYDRGREDGIKSERARQNFMLEKSKKN